MLAGWHFIRVIAAWQYRAVLADYAPFPGAFYIGLSGLIWGILFSLTAYGQWRNHPRLKNWLIPVWVGWMLWFWLDRLFLQHHTPAGGANRLFLLLVQTAVSLVFWAETHLTTTEGSTHQ